MAGRRVIVPPPKSGAGDEEPLSLSPITAELEPPPMPRLGRKLKPGRHHSIFPEAARKSIASFLPAARLSIESMLPAAWKPRWKPWSPSRALGATIAFGLLFGVLVFAAYPRLAPYAGRFYMRVRPAQAMEEPVVAPAAAAAPLEDNAAEEHFSRQGRSPVAGGVFSIPAGFHSSDGSYDLIIHFHGNTDLVEESVSAANTNAVLVIFNQGIGSGAYEDRFSVIGIMPDILERVQNTLTKRGLATPHLRRLALTAWSAGYGAIERILEQPGMQDKVDAVVLLDGIHCGYMADNKTLDLLRIKSFIDYAKLAADGRKLFYITHSNIEPTGYAGTHATTDALLKEIGLERKPMSGRPVMPTLQSLIGVLPKDSVKPLKQESEIVQKGLSVRGYSGTEPEDHMSHLMQMSTTALPALNEYWSKKP